MPCITLLSDFGLLDASVAVAKGILMQHVPQAPILDISHEVMPFHTRQAAYLLAAACNSFPAGSCHVVLADVFSDKTPKLLLTENNGQYFLGADNRIIPMALGRNDSCWLYFEMNSGDSYADWLHATGKIVALLQTTTPTALGLPTYTPKSIVQNIPRLSDDGAITCDVIHIDHYGNVVLNMTKKEFEALGNHRSFRLQYKRVEDIDVLSNNYADVREGYKLARFNSNGFLEISINRGNAASLFGLRLGGKNNDIKIFFE